MYPHRPLLRLLSISNIRRLHLCTRMIMGTTRTIAPRRPQQSSMKQNSPGMLTITTPYGMATTVTGYTTNTTVLISTGTTEDISTADGLTVEDSNVSITGMYVGDMITTAGGRKRLESKNRLELRRFFLFGLNHYPSSPTPLQKQLCWAPALLHPSLLFPSRGSH